jgi:hypothetical protein
MDELHKININMFSKKISLFGCDGEEKEIMCDSIDQFMNVLSYINSVIDDQVKNDFNLEVTFTEL